MIAREHGELGVAPEPGHHAHQFGGARTPIDQVAEQDELNRRGFTLIDIKSNF
jgi:hypothetical protein